MELAQRIEGILFYKGEPVLLADLARMVGANVEEVQSALPVLTASLSGRGVRLLIAGEQISLVTAPELSSLIETLQKEELKRDIGKAGAETLAIVLYKGPITRADIDYIRGVNSSFILRNLMMRGLVVRKEHEKDVRTYAYASSSELFACELKTLEEGKKYDLIVTPKGVDAPGMGVIRIETDCEISKHRVQQAFAVLRKPAAVQPAVKP